jgi:hypothetical protein
MKRRLLAVIILVAAILPAQAHFARLWEPVPTDRLFANVGRYVREHPKDPRGHYTLGRLHALVYSSGTRPVDKLDVVMKDWKSGKPVALPDFVPYDSVRVKPPAVSGKLPEASRIHLAASLGEYHWAVAMAPKEPLYLLGFAWMLEQGAAHAAEVGEATSAMRVGATEEAFRQRALDLYRQAYALTIKKEVDEQARNITEGDTSIATEAGEGILSILGKSKHQTDFDRAEMARVKRDLAEISAKPAFVTPVVFTMRPVTTLQKLLGERTARFDLAASGRADIWPWVKPDTGILVWDPERSGRIVSGRQLFGSRTWQMFWRNGYEALAALDDDGNGWLEGRELAGIAVWFDRNGNGRSDTGEVIPVAALGITRIRVWPDGVRDDVPWSESGIELADGRRIPTWDWTPRSLAAEPRMPAALQTWN